MDGSRWARIDALLGEASELPAVEVEEFLASATDDESIRHEVRSLLAHMTGRAGALLAEAVGHGAQVWEATATRAQPGLLGRTVGPYRVTSVLGTGGMGVVYRARRDDGQFEQEVAIKLVRHGYESPAALDRFRQERQILARLTDPAIARLLDGGTITDEGGHPVPYLVMEYVDGEPITDYCTSRALPIKERLRLFRTVIDAVQHAHQQLVVHRDLKPGNMLVTPDGQPKLLDFGIAKLLVEGGPDLTVAGGALTPAYASPEQVNGDVITAATDVYALGAVLYELLCGQKAHRFEQVTTREITRIVTEAAIVAPSQAVSAAASDAARQRRALAGDLDTIVLKALRKEPARRYASAEQFGADIDRYLSGLPVQARPDTFGYRAGKFVRRHAVAVAAAVLVVASLVGGIVATTRQARIAEKRFLEVRALANAFLFDFDAQIRDVPGTVKARELLVKTALTYLDSLARQASGDSSLQLELAEAYRKVGDVQYEPRGASLGHVGAAIESHRKALALSEALARWAPANARYQRLLAGSEMRLGMVLTNAGDIPGGIGHLRRALGAARAALAVDPADPENTLTLLEAHDYLGNELLATRDLPAVLDNARSAIAAAEGLAGRVSDDRIQRALARSHENVAEVLMQMGDLTAASDHLRYALGMRESVATARRGETAARRELVNDHQMLGDLLGSPVAFSLGDAQAAEAQYRQAVTIEEELAAADANDAQARLRLGILYRKLGNVLSDRSPRQAVELYRRSVALFQTLLAGSPENVTYLRYQALAHLGVARPLHALGEAGPAITSVRRAFAIQQAIIAKAPARRSVQQDMVVTHNVAGDLHLAVGEHNAALQSYRDALALAEAIRSAAPDDDYARRDLADCHERFGAFWSAQAASSGVPPALRRERWQDARAWYLKSLAIWSDWIEHGPSNEYVTRRRDQVMGAVGRADSALAKLGTTPQTP